MNETTQINKLGITRSQPKDGTNMYPNVAFSLFRKS